MRDRQDAAADTLRRARYFEVGEQVRVKGFGKEAGWQPAVVIPAAQRNYDVQVGSSVVRRHIYQMLPKSSPSLLSVDGPAPQHPIDLPLESALASGPAATADAGGAVLPAAAATAAAAQAATMDNPGAVAVPIAVPVAAQASDRRYPVRARRQPERSQTGV